MFKRFPNKIKKEILLPVFLFCFVVVIFPHVASADIGATVEKFLYDFVVTVFGFFAGFGATMLDYSINEMVVGFGKLYIDEGMGASIDKLWVIMRDFFNLTFIFGLVMIGLRMIFDSSNSSTRKMLISLILAALFVNFSLFITKFVVDFSNIAAVQLVNSFHGSGGISASFMNLMGGSGLLAAKNLDQMQGGTGLIFIMGTMVVLIILTFVFMAGALLLMVRFVALNLYMLLSPLMFIGMVFPAAMSVTRQYWSGFLGKAFFGPAYILMLYFSFNILEGFKFTGGNNMADAFTKSTDAKVTILQVFPPFIVTAIFLIASLIVAQKMGVQGANGVISTGKMLTGKAKKYTTNAAKSTASAVTYPVRAGARMGVNKLGSMTNTGFNKWQAKAQTDAQKSGAGIGAKALGWMAATNVVDRKARGVAATMKGAQFGTGTTNEAEDTYKNKTQSGINQQVAENQRKVNVAAAEATIAVTNSSTELKTALDNLGKSIRDMSKDEKVDLGYQKLTDKNYAVHLSDSDIESLDKSGKFSAQEIKNIKDARSEAFKSIATHGTTHTKKDPITGNVIYASAAAGTTTTTVSGDTVHTSASGMDQRGDVARRGARDVGKMPIEVFKEKGMYAHLTPTMLEERIKNGMTSDERADIRDALADYLQIPRTETPATASTPLLANDPWVKWENGNSAFAAQFFA